jgi:25S rRNA (adenine2142-N1)-methyltransferase
MPRKQRPLFVPLRSLARARAVTSRFHELTQELKQRRAAGEDTASVQAALNSLGGRDAYQEASVLTTERHKTSRFVYSTLQSMGLRPQAGEPPLRLLEVGAVNLQLSSCPWLSTRAIDLRSTHPRIEEMDFFSLRPRGAFTAVVCSMIMNCVPDASSRGRMLLGLRAHLAVGGLAFVMLPLRCLESSRHCSWRLFETALACAGLQVVSRKTSPKVAFIAARAVTELAAVPDSLRPPALGKREGARSSSSSDFSVCFAD